MDEKLKAMRQALRVNGLLQQDFELVLVEPEHVIEIDIELVYKLWQENNDLKAELALRRAQLRQVSQEASKIVAYAALPASEDEE